MKGNFQIIILVVFIAAAILGVLVFSGAIPIGKTGAGSLGTVVLWGTVPAQVMNAPIQHCQHRVYDQIRRTFSGHI